MSEFVVRHLEEWFDLAALGAIDREVLAHDSNAAHGRCVLEANHNFHVLARNGQPVGYSYCAPKPGPKKKTIYIVRIMMRPFYQRRGLGSLLMASIMKRSRKTGFELAEIDVFTSQKPAIEFLVHSGFSRRKTRRSTTGGKVETYTFNLQQNYAGCWVESLSQKHEHRQLD